MIVSRPGGFYSRPAFPETIIITVLFEPSGFQKVIFSVQIVSFTVFSVFLCAICYTTFLSLFFHNTTVNAEPLSPAIF